MISLWDELRHLPLLPRYTPKDSSSQVLERENVRADDLPITPVLLTNLYIVPTEQLESCKVDHVASLVIRKSHDTRPILKPSAEEQRNQETHKSRNTSRYPIHKPSQRASKRLTVWICRCLQLSTATPSIQDYSDAMADTKKVTDGPYPFSPEAFDASLLPDIDTEFLDDADLTEFAKALSEPDNTTHDPTRQSSVFITALNDWRPVHQRVRGRPSSTTDKQRQTLRAKDETRDGVVYTLLKWPLFFFVTSWIVVLGALYFLTRTYIYFYEQKVTWRGQRQKLRKRLQSTQSYGEWVEAAKAMDEHLGTEEWKRTDEYAYYDSATVRRVTQEMHQTRKRAEEDEDVGTINHNQQPAVDDLRALVEACVKNNFAGIENPRLYSQTYYGTKYLVQAFVDEVESSLSFLLRTKQLSQEDKNALFKQIHTNFGRSALCLSGGATFAYYHFGVAKALLDANLLPQVITGTSGGAVVAALLSTRTDDELKKLLVPALSARITACKDDFFTWTRRLYRTGARFDSLQWARACSWFTRGSMTFREAYERTGRILNVTCVPSDPHSPTILANYLTCPNCVIWSAVLASAAVPGILSPVVLMMKKRDGTLAPYSFGHKWKDGSLRTDIPLKSLNLHFNVHFSIVSQANPHINLFFFSSRGTVGRPVTHRRGRGWRGGYLGSATEQYIKLDLNKWLKVLRHLELLPRPLGQDWSEVWLQRFSGTITLWPKAILSDFWYILSDPGPQRLARMLHAGQQCTFPKLKFISNRMKVERLIDEGRRSTRLPDQPQRPELLITPSEEEVQQSLQRRPNANGGFTASPRPQSPQTPPSSSPEHSPAPASTKPAKPVPPKLEQRQSRWWPSFTRRSMAPKLPARDERHSLDSIRPILSSILGQDTAGDGTHSETQGGLREATESAASPQPRRRQQLNRGESVLMEIRRQSRVFLDDSAGEDDDNGNGRDDTLRHEWNAERSTSESSSEAYEKVDGQYTL